MIRSDSFIKIRFQIIVLLLVCFLINGCEQGNVKIPVEKVGSDSLTAKNSGNRELRNVNFLPYWVTNAQFAGYYVGIEKGIYEKYGIKMNLISYRPFVTSTDLIAGGKVDFAALWLVNAIELKAKGTDIVNIAQVSSRSSAMLITKKESGIRTLQDMNGKRAGIWSGYELQPKALFNKYNLDVKIVPIGSTNNLFLMGGVDITIANWFDEYHSIINSGYDPDDLNVFFFADYGMNFLEDGIYCLSDKLKNDPRLCADFVMATLESWRYAFNNKEETIDIVLEYAKRDKFPVNRVHQKWMFDRYKDMYLPEGKTEFNNFLSEKDYQFIGDLLKNEKLITKVPSFEKFYQPIIKQAK
jgi:NitT/TauT family transport system substrate-binding protein